MTTPNGDKVMFSRGQRFLCLAPPEWMARAVWSAAIGIPDDVTCYGVPLPVKGTT